MANASTNRSKISYVQEVTAGVTPANPKFKELRVTSSELNFEPTRVESNEIRADRQKTDSILTLVAANGNLGIELSYQAYDDMLEAAVQGTWINKPSITVATADTEISDVSATTLTVSAGGSNFKTGHLTLTSGFATPANNGLHRVTSNTTTTIVYPAASFLAESDPIPVGVTVRVIGFEGAEDDIETVASGLKSTLLDFTTLGLNAGEWIKIGGDSAGSKFDTAAVNSLVRIGSVAAHLITLDIKPSGWAVDSGTDKTIQVFTGDFLINGTTVRSFSVERQQQDIASPSYELFKGQQVNTFSLSLQSSAILTGTLGMIGLGGTADTVRTSGASDIAAPAFGVLNTSSNMRKLSEGGVLVGGETYITQFGYDINNNMEGEAAIGYLSYIGIRNGEFGLSGSISFYMNDINLLNKVINDTESSFMFAAGRGDGNRESYLFDIPRVKLTGSSPVSGKNQSRMFTGNYAALRHKTLGYTTSIARFWHLPAAA